MQFKLAAILAADVAGYSRLMHENETAIIRAWQLVRSEIIKPTIRAYEGRIVKHTGDGFLAEFVTVSEAVNCAISLQRKLQTHFENKDDAETLNFRMGINVGEIAVDEDDIHGDGVNIAARLESISDAPGICVTAQVYEEVYRKLDCNFEDIGFHQVKNIDDPLHVYKVKCGHVGNQTTAAQDTQQKISAPPQTKISLPSGIPSNSIAVLPLVNMSSDPEQDFFADGLTEDLLTELSRFGELFVISRNSSFAYKGQSKNIKEIAEELGVQYVVEGSVRKAGNRIRVNIQLIDGPKDRHIWAEKFDRNLEDIFEIQDEITSSIAATLPGRVEADHMDRLRRISPEKMAAYEYLLAGKVLHHNPNRENNEKALEYMDRALEVDPEHSHSWAWKACILGQRWVNGWYEGSEDEIKEQIFSTAAHAQEIDPNDADTQRIQAAICMIKGDIDGAAAHQKDAL
ncbi:MAG: adenylate/guanylate cyclase domain-containing protein, partial [Alphaproteobacteria bacterium]|nr:adenylate/guanylate cyclase domain-containing protein [Alphaproteobacteria bacterium]